MPFLSEKSRGEEMTKAIINELQQIKGILMLILKTLEKQNGTKVIDLIQNPKLKRIIRNMDKTRGMISLAEVEKVLDEWGWNNLSQTKLDELKTRLGIK